MNKVVQALAEWNSQGNTSAWSLGDSYDPSKVKEYNNFFKGFLFPKVAETIARKTSGYNHFQDLVIEDTRTSLINEEYAVLDTVPTFTNFTQDDVHILNSNFPRIGTRVFTKGVWRKFKITINLLTAPRSFHTFADVVEYYLEVIESRIKMLNVIEEKETIGLLVDYSNTVKENMVSTSISDTVRKISLAVDNLQNNNQYNEVTSVMGEGYELTDASLLKDILIVTSTAVKAELRDSVLAQNFHNEGIDLSNQIRAFSDLGGVWKVTKDITLNQTQQSYVQSKGLYNFDKDNNVLKAGTIITFPIAGQESNMEEIKPPSDNFAIVLDKRGLVLKQDTSYLKAPEFTNGETMNVNIYMHYASSKYLSIFTPKVVIKEG